MFMSNSRNIYHRGLCLFLVAVLLFGIIGPVVPVSAATQTEVEGWKANESYATYFTTIRYSNSKDNTYGSAVTTANNDGFILTAKGQFKANTVTTLTLTVGSSPVVITYTTEGTAVTASINSGSSVPAWSTVTFSLTSPNGSGTSNTATIKITVAPSNVEYPSDMAHFAIGDKYFHYLDEALGVAKAGDTIIVTKSGTAYPSTWKTDGTNYTFVIPNGVKLLIPFDNANTADFDEEPNTSSENPGGSQYAFRTLTLGAGTTIDCQGQICVNGSVYGKNGAYPGVTTGPYGQIALSSENSKIIVNGGTLYCYGYITGAGEVIANSGTVYEVFQPIGWKGGAATAAWYKNKKVESFPFNDYAIQNIEADFTIHYGATAMAIATIAVSSITKQVPVAYIGTGAGFVQLDSTGAFVYRSFTPATSRMCYTLHGDTKVGSVNIDIEFDWDEQFILNALGISDLDMNSANYILAIPHYMDFVAASGSTVTLLNNYKMLPGASLTVENGAKAIVKGNLYLYDTADFVGKGYNKHGLNSIPPQKIATTGSLFGNIPMMDANTPSAQVIVNGTLQIDGGMFTTVNGGTSMDKVIKGTGTIINNSTKTSDDIGLDEYT